MWAKNETPEISKILEEQSKIRLWRRSRNFKIRI